jgi:murein DD-endopeptidase MepM/ murein hydrolase activator NlpD
MSFVGRVATRRFAFSSSRRKKRRVSTRPTVLLALLLCAFSATAAPPEIEGQWKQGELLRGHVAPGSQLRFKGQRVNVGDDGLFIIGLDRDEPATVELEVIDPDGTAHKSTHAVASRQYKIQRIDGLPQDKVNAPPEVSERIEREAALVREARFHDTPRTDFLQGFVWPCTGRISGVYGSQRILNGEPKQPHYGVDVAVPTGTPVKAPAGGVVRLAEPDLYYTGGTLIIDHGHGLASAFLHLSKLRAKVGDVVEQGQVVASSGATGRATGPHLDWRISWLDARIDPQRLVPAMPATSSKKESKKAKP